MMWGNIVGWLKALSIGKKIGIGISTLVVASAAASPSSSAPSTTPPDTATQAEVTEVVDKKTVTETEEIPYSKKNIDDPSLNKGSTKIITSGVNGIKTLVYEITYVDGKETDKKLVSEKVTTIPVAEVTAVGTYTAPKQNCDPNYTPCVPNVSYDLDCPDIGFSVTVIGYDKHGFDGSDNDGYGCESY